MSRPWGSPTLFIASWCTLGALLVAVPFTACSSDEETGSLGGTGPTATGTAADGGDAAHTSTGGFGFGGFGQGAGTAGGGGDDACAGDVQAAEMLPLDMYVMLDRSMSMNEETSIAGVTKWQAVTQALKDFANDQASAGLGVGMGYFPANDTCTVDGDCPGSYCYLKSCNNTLEPQPCQSDADCPGPLSGTCVDLGQCGAATCTNVGDTCGTEACTAVTSSVCVIADICPVSQYSTPDVTIAFLPSAATVLTASLDGKQPAPLPYGFTPMGPALQGAVDYAKSWKTANPTHQVIVVLATDGSPTRCAPTGTAAVAAIAAVGLNTSPEVQTFTIGVFEPSDTDGPDNIQAIADAGGGQSFVVDGSGNVGQQFVAALNSIRGEALECEFEVPEPPPNETLDYDKVNVEFTDGDGNTKTIPYVGHPGNCDATDGGWYYDVDPSAGTPSKIIVCPANCDEFKETIGAKVEIRVGCETIVPA